MQKQILYGKEARQKMMDGIERVAKAVVTTLGPNGRNVVISRCFPSQTGMQYYMPFVTKDGVTVARNITLDDQIENTGANLIKQAAEKTMSDAGDGTTTTCLLMNAIMQEGLKLIDAGKNQQDLKRELDESVRLIVSRLKEMSIPVNGDIEKIRQVATVSANNDSAIGDLIAEAFEKIGMTGDIDIEESKGAATEIKITDGFKFNRGWLSPYFIKNQSKQDCELLNPYILLYDKKITKFKDLENILDLTIKEDRPMLIICDDADGEALATVAMNAYERKRQWCIVKSPEFGDLKREAMEDLAVVTGALYISDEKGKSLAKATMSDLGQADKVIIGKDETIIVNAKSNKDELAKLLTNLKDILLTKDGKDKDDIARRIAKLTGSIAVLYVGAATEVEMKEKKDRVDDAVRATKAAISEGIVPGGGTAFIRCLMPTVFGHRGIDDLMNDVLREPLNQICKNAGVDSQADAVLERGGNFGYNAKTDKIEDLVLSGIVDPVKVLRCSLENAASAATMILTSETLIVDTL